MINDAHCHFFSRAFFDALAQQRGRAPRESASDLTRTLQWEDPGDAAGLANRWVRELDAHVARFAAPGADGSVRFAPLVTGS